MTNGGDHGGSSDGKKAGTGPISPKTEPTKPAS